MGGIKHVTSACLSCRRRKIKCDGNEPCSCCSISKLECVYNAEADMRRIPARKIITDLRSRVTELENALREQQMKQLGSNASATTSAAPGDSPSNSSSATGNQEDGGVATDETREDSLIGSSIRSSSGVDDRVHDSEDETSNSPATGSFRQNDDDERQVNPDLSTGTDDDVHLATMGLVNPRGEHHGDSTNFMFFDQENDFRDGQMQSNNLGDDRRNMFTHVRSPIRHAAPPHPAHPPPAYDDLPNQNSSGSEDEITDILAARMGGLRIAEDGELRYYGPTSNLHVHPNGSHSLSCLNIRHVETEGLGVLERLGLAQEISLATEAHLAKLYFCWEDPAIHVVDEATFFAEKENTVVHGKKSPYYSETLNNAICAIGANLACGEYLGIPEPAPEFFSSRAKALLDIEMDSPTVATVQALVVMSASEAAFTRDARGWLYSGMAARLSADLGLHLDVTQHMQNGILTERDLEIRRITFWGVFIHEHMWSMYVGRPWSIGVNNITVPRPRSAFDNSRRWKPYPGRAGQWDIPSEGVAFPLEACTDANISICEFFPRINAALYSGPRLPDIKEMVDFLARTRAELWELLDGLPPALRVDSSSLRTPYVPAVLQLHMQFHAALIALYRPYLSRSILRSGQSLASQQDRTVLLEATSGCMAAAHEIAKLLRCYQRQHSLPRCNIQIVHIILTACLVFVHDVCTRAPADARTSQTDLQFCCHALGEIGHAFGNATRALEVIILVRSEWQKLASARRAPTAGLKRRSTSMVTPGLGGTPGQESDHRAKRRSFCSNAPDELPRPAAPPAPPAFSAFQMLYNDFASHSADMSMPAIGEDVPGAPWDIPLDATAGLNELMMPVGWPGTQLMQPMLGQGTASFVTDGQMAQKSNSGKSNGIG